MIPLTRPSLGEAEVGAAGEVILSGWVTQGPSVKKFEDAFASFVGAEHACAVSSCTAALHLALLTLGVGPGDVVCVEEPTYDRALTIFRRAGAQLLGLAIGFHGPSVEALEDRLRRGERPKLFYVIPDFQNPSGSLLSEEKRRRIAALAQAYGFWILEDVPYRKLRYRGEDLPTILEYFPEQERPDFPRAAPSEWMPDVGSQLDGSSLRALAHGERQAPSEIVVEAQRGRAYIAPPWKLIWHKDGSPAELFHLVNDPLELNDRAEEEKQVARELSEKLRLWVEANLAGRRTDPIFETNGAWNCWLAEKPGVE